MKKLTIGILALTFLFGITSCKKQLDKLGPDLCPSDGFSVVASDIVLDGLNTSNEVNLSSGGLHIKAKFTEVVKWSLKLISEDGASIKSFEGETDSINTWWFGNVDAFPLFKKGNVKVELEIACLDLITKSFVIKEAPTFKNVNSSYGVLIRDFDKNGIVPVAGNEFTVADGWAGLNGSDSNHYQYFDVDPSPMGGKYGELYSKGPDVTWYHGATSFPITNFAGKLITTNPDSVYVNFYCKGYGLVNTGLEFALTSAGTNYFYTEPITWEGWKLISLKLSDLKVLAGSKAGQKLTDVDGISQCIMQLGSNPERTNEARSAYDFILLTVGEPFIKE